MAGSALASAVAFPFMALASAVLIGFTLFMAFVFRDPNRSPGHGVVAPADGIVRDVDEGRGLISTYLALRNVHVTRTPVEGVVARTKRISGGHAPAFSKRAGHNEKVEVLLQTGLGEVSVVHMVGALARRIVPYVSEGQSLEKGARMGLIRFGSRVDLVLPRDRVRIVAKKGQRLRAGVTCVAEVLDGSLE